MPQISLFTIYNSAVYINARKLTFNVDSYARMDRIQPSHLCSTENLYFLLALNAKPLEWQWMNRSVIYYSLG